MKHYSSRSSFFFFTNIPSSPEFTPPLPTIKFPISRVQNDYKVSQCRSEDALLVLLLHIGKKRRLCGSTFLYFNLITKLCSLNKMLSLGAKALLYYRPIFSGNPLLTSYRSLCLFIDNLPFPKQLSNVACTYDENGIFSRVVCLDLTSIYLGFMDELIGEKQDWLLRIFQGLPQLKTFQVPQSCISGLIDSKVVSRLIEGSLYSNKEPKKTKNYKLRLLSVPGLDIRTGLIAAFVSLFPELEALDISSSPCLTTLALKECVVSLPRLNYLNISFCPNLTGDLTELLVGSPSYLNTQDGWSQIIRKIVNIGNPQLNAYPQPPAYSEK